MQTAINEVTRALSEVLDLEDTKDLIPAIRFVEDLDFDSGMFIELLMTIEDNIDGLTIDPARLEQKDFATIETLASYIDQLRKVQEVHHVS